MTDPHVSTRLSRRTWAAIIVLAASAIGGAVGIISWWNGLNGSNALVAAVASFTGTTTVGFRVFDFVVCRPTPARDAGSPCLDLAECSDYRTDSICTL